MTQANSGDDDGGLQETLATVRDARALFLDAERRALAAGAPPPAGLVEAVRSDFDAIETEIASAGPDAFETLTDRADRLSRLRAYVYPKEEVAFAGRSLFSDLSQWGVPPAILAELQKDSLEALSDQDEHRARGALRTLYDAWDYWGWYVDWYADFMRNVARWLIALEAVALLLMVNRFVCGDIILGFVTAGLAGALVSVISKMPPLMADADSNAYTRRILMRVGTGTAAALIGGGFLASGLLNIALPSDRVTLAELIEVCGKHDSCWPFRSWWQAPRRDAAPGSPERAQQLAPAPPGTPAPPGAPAPPAQGVPANVPDAQPKTLAVAVKCSTGGILLLMALGLLLGFSERALTTFEERLFTGGAPPPNATPSPSRTPPLATPPPSATPSPSRTPPPATPPPSQGPR